MSGMKQFLGRNILILLKNSFFPAQNIYFSLYCWAVSYLYMIFRAFSSIWENNRGIQWQQGYKIQNFKKFQNPKITFFSLCIKMTFNWALSKNTKHVSWKKNKILVLPNNYGLFYDFYIQFPDFILSVQLNIMTAISLKIIWLNLYLSDELKMLSPMQILALFVLQKVFVLLKLDQNFPPLKCRSITISLNVA